MLHRNLQETPLKWWSATEPLIDYYTQRILITRWSWHTPQLFRSQVGGRPRQPCFHSIFIHRDALRRNQSQAKVTQQHLILGAKQDILRLDIPMHQSPLMGILQ